MQLYVLSANGKQAVLLHEAAVISGWKSGLFTKETLVSMEGLDEWTPLGRIISVEAEEPAVGWPGVFDRTNASATQIDPRSSKPLKDYFPKRGTLIAAGIIIVLLVFLFSPSSDVCWVILSVITAAVFLSGIWVGSVLLTAVVAVLLFFLGMTYIDFRFPEEAAVRNGEAHQRFQDGIEAEQREKRLQHQRAEASGATAEAFDQILKERHKEDVEREKERLRNGIPPND